MNLIGLTAVALSIAAFVFTYLHLRGRSIVVRAASACVLTVLATPSLLFAVYYLHVLPERTWFYTLRSWPGTEFLVLFLGGAVGAFASLLPRPLLPLTVIAVVTLGVVPHVKPIIGPLPDSAFQEHWQGDVCLQSTPSTCGPASVATILRRLRIETTERATARAAFSYERGTEAWYLARYVRSKGLEPRFDFRRTFSPSVGFPAVVGVRFGGVGHFIAVLDVQGDQVTYADPLSGEQRVSLTQFQRNYDFTGFHMVVSDNRGG